MADAYEKNARTLGRTFIDVKRLPAGGSDIGNVRHRVPTLHPLIAASPPQVMIHDPEFTKWSNSGLGDKAVVDGAKALAMTALDIFLNDDLRGRVNAEFIASKNESYAAILSAWRDSAHIRHAGAGCC